MNKGVSILETVLYIAIFAMIALLTVHTVLAFTRAVGEIRNTRHTIRESAIAMERIIREIRATESIDTAASVFGSHPGKLILTNASDTLTFSFSNGNIFLQKNSESAVSLTSDATTVTNLVFTHLTAANSEAIRIAMTIDNNQFYGTAVLRTNYK
jgi:hypothetical protein